MVDIHYHLLFGVDDGPQTLEDATALAEASIKEGVTHIVATPHANYTFLFNPQVNREKLDKLQDRLGGRVTLGLGCDFHLSFENLQDIRRDPSKYTINGKQYLLVEFSDAAIPVAATDILYDLRLSGLVPIITHPERNPLLVHDPRRMADWIRGGCLVQVTAASLTGRFGRRAKAMCSDLIQKNWVHFISSDAHSLDGRPPAMAEGYQALANDFGKDTAERLCVRNPRAAFYGEQLELQPEPLNIYEEAHAGRRGFLRGFFGR